MIEAIAAISFAETPLEEIGTRANQILSLGWTVRDRGDPWVILVAKHFDESERLPEAELHDVTQVASTASALCGPSPLLPAPKGTHGFL